MTRIGVILALAGLIAPMAAPADTVVPARTIPARSVISASDLMVQDAIVPGAVSDPEQIIGMEARVALYAGRPVRAGDVGFPAVVDRNQIVPLIYESTILTIRTEGRALDRAGPGELIRVMNLSSRSTVTARIGVDGAAYVSQ